MVKYKFKEYTLIESWYNGTPVNYVLDGRVVNRAPSRRKYKGYLKTEDGVVMIYETNNVIWKVLLCSILLAVAILAYPRNIVGEYRVSFSQHPSYVDGTLHCNVINVSDIPVVVHFENTDSASVDIPLEPGEALSTVELEFIPTYIVYNTDYKFKLEVKS